MEKSTPRRCSIRTRAPQMRSESPCIPSPPLTGCKHPRCKVKNECERELKTVLSDRWSSLTVTAVHARPGARNTKRKVMTSVKLPVLCAVILYSVLFTLLKNLVISFPTMNFLRARVFVEFYLLNKKRQKHFVIVCGSFVPAVGVQ